MLSVFKTNRIAERSLPESARLGNDHNADVTRSNYCLGYEVLLTHPLTRSINATVHIAHSRKAAGKARVPSSLSRHTLKPFRKESKHFHQAPLEPCSLLSAPC